MVVLQAPQFRRGSGEIEVRMHDEKPTWSGWAG